MHDIRRYQAEKYLDQAVERDPALWDRELSRRALFRSAFAVSIGASALLSAQGAQGAPVRAAGTRGAARRRVRTTMVATQRVAASTLNVDAPGFRSEVLLSCYPGLVDIDIPPNFDEARKQLATVGETIIPMLAKSWTVSKNKKVWTFDLQPNAKSVAGNPLQAIDVQWSADKWTVGSTFVSNLLSRLATVTSSSQIKALTPLRVRFVFTDVPPPFLLGLLSLPFMAIYDSTEIKKHVSASDPWGNAWLKTNIAGFGPYTITANSPTGDQQTFEVNKGYWDYPKTPKITKINRLVIPDPGTRLQLLLAGQADLADELPYLMQDVIVKSKDHEVTVFATARTMFLAMDNSVSPFENPTIRRGIAYAVPYAQILKYVYRGRAKPWKTIIVPYFPGATDKYWRFDTNLALAKSLLKDIVGIPLTLNYPIGSPADEQTAIFVQQGLKAAGVNIKIAALDGTIYQVKKGTGQLSFYTDAQDTPIVADPVYDLNRYFTSKALQPTIIKYKYQADVDALIAEANSTQDFAALLPLLDKIQSIVVPQVPLIPIAWTGNQSAHVKTLQGYKSHAFTLQYFQDLYFTE